MNDVPFVDLLRSTRPLLDSLADASRRVLESGTYLYGRELAAYEGEAAEWFGRKHAVGVASGTDACEIAIRALGLEHGHRVALPAFGAVPTINALEAAGVTPVLVDVDPITRNVEYWPGGVDAYMVVHMFGVPSGLPPSMETTIEDCAHAQGARIHGKRVGSFGALAAISHYPTKPCGTYGDGVLVLTDSKAIAEKMQRIRHYGRNDTGDIAERGQNSRLSEIQAAFLRVKLPMTDAWNEERRRLARRYTAELAGRVSCPIEPTGRECVFHVYAVQHQERDRLVRGLRERGIGCMVHYDRAINQYRRWNQLGRFPVAEHLARTVLSLPIYPGLTDAEQDAVIAAVKELT